MSRVAWLSTSLFLGVILTLAAHSWTRLRRLSQGAVLSCRI